jgi:hypothetical protein
VSFAGVDFWASDRPKPQRLQRERKRGWRKPYNTIDITRPGPYGNPYFPGCGRGYGYFDEQMRMVNYSDRDPAQCVLMFRFHMRDMKKYEPAKYRAYIGPLRGRNVMCWCKPGEPCHGDVLIELACEEP